METGTEYHGQKIDPASAPADVPPAPPEPEGADERLRPLEELAAASVTEELRELEPPMEPTDWWPENGLWPTVVISGKYGWTLCSESQTAEWHEITRREAWNLGWTYFGNCRHTVYFFDDEGRVRIRDTIGFIG